MVLKQLLKRSPFYRAYRMPGRLRAAMRYYADPLKSVAVWRAFLFFREQPQDHWYPGAGIGIAYRPDAVR
jgi:hypothetical protein